MLDIYRDELDDLLYLFSVSFYCLGIDDRFNICVGNVEDIRTLCTMLKQHFDNHNFNIPEQKLMVEMIAQSYFLTYNSTLAYLKPTLPTINKVELETIFDKFSYLMIKLLCFLISVPKLRPLSNEIVRLILVLFNKFEKLFVILYAFLYKDELKFKIEMNHII